MKANMTGLAGEFRVMSELLLRGHNPAKSYLEDGADLILENGLRVEVKSAHNMPQEHVRKRYSQEHYRRTGQRMSPITRYQFDMTEGHNTRTTTPQEYDYLVCWCIDHNLFYILPRQLPLPKGKLSIFPESNSKYNQYREAWNLLKERTV